VGITGSYNMNPVTVGQTTVLNIAFSQNDLVAYPVNNVEVYITFPQAIYDCNMTPTGDFMTYFANFNDNDNDGVWFGTNTIPIPALLSGGFVGCTLNMVVTAIAPGTGSTLLNTDFAATSPFTDTEDGDNGFASPLIVNAPLPIKLVTFEGRSKDCEHIDLSWTTAQERNNDYIEVQRSINGTEFSTIGKVSGNNRSDLNAYTFEDNTNLIPGAKYYYRLRQVDFDGSAEFHRIIGVEHTCIETPLALNIYPNPAIDKINIVLTGMKVATDVKLSVLNNEGKTIRNITINSGVNNEYLLNDLPAGVYHLRADDLDQVLNAKFIRIQ
jgi:hypothetical protein